MMYHGCHKQDIPQAGGVRRVELRFSGDIDGSGHLHLKRCVGKSFFIKSTQETPAQGTDIGSAHRFSHFQPDQTA